jgi:hypothetical protein
MKKQTFCMKSVRHFSWVSILLFLFSMGTASAQQDTKAGVHLEVTLNPCYKIGGDGTISLYPSTKESHRDEYFEGFYRTSKHPDVWNKCNFGFDQVIDYKIPLQDPADLVIEVKIVQLKT